MTLEERIKIKKSIIAEAKVLATCHPSKDCRSFADSVLKWFENDTRETMQALKGSVTERRGMAFGCVVHYFIPPKEEK